MPKLTAEKALSSIEAFKRNSVKTMSETPTGQLAQALKRRSFGEKHFAQLNKYITEIKSLDIITIDEEYKDTKSKTVNKRKISYDLKYMTFQHNQKANKFETATYIPTHLQLKMGLNTIIEAQRVLPLCFSASHVEDRYSFRTYNAQDGYTLLQYNSKDFNRSVQIGLMMAISIAAKMVDDKQTWTPVLLPHEKGFFVGRAEFCNINAYYPKTTLIGRRGEEPAGLEHYIKPEISPVCHLQIRTFYGLKTLSSEQEELHALMMEKLSETDIDKKLTTLADSYPLSLMEPETELDYINEIHIHNVMMEIFNSDLWEKANKNGWQHTPGSEYMELSKNFDW